VTGAPPLFELSQVCVEGDDGNLRLRDVTGEIPAVGITAIVGPSGSGKSTLLRCCNRLVVPARGTVRYRGTDLATLDPLALRRKVAMVFQRPTPFRGTGFDNLRVPVPSLGRARARELLAHVRLDASFLDRDATTLSGGEAQRLCLARALVLEPEVVLMDEVTSSVDPGARLALEELARDLAHHGTAVLWVTHDLQQARRLADHVMIVVEGRIALCVDAAALDAPSSLPPAARAFVEGVTTGDD
jgi:putative ABC transport system ATP-binding protein